MRVSVLRSGNHQRGTLDCARGRAQAREAHGTVPLRHMQLPIVFTRHHGSALEEQATQGAHASNNSQSFTYGIMGPSSWR